MLSGHGGRPAAFEFIFVENVQPSFYYLPKCIFGSWGAPFGGIALGHAAIAFTRPDGTRRLVNIVGGREAAGGREMVEFWEQPYDYFYGRQGKAGIFARSMCILRVQEWDASGIEAIELCTRLNPRSGFRTRLNPSARLTSARPPELPMHAALTSAHLPMCL